MTAHEENSRPPTGINLSAYKDLAVAADSGVLRRQIRARHTALRHRLMVNTIA